MRHTIFCKHHCDMHISATCLAGVEFAKFKGTPFERFPCFKRPDQDPNPGCDKAEFPTPEELEAEDQRFRERFARVGKAAEAIGKKLGPWRRGSDSVSGAMNCPCCGGKGTLSYGRAGSNGHLRGHCIGPGCDISFIA